MTRPERWTSIRPICWLAGFAVGRIVRSAAMRSTASSALVFLLRGVQPDHLCPELEEPAREGKRTATGGHRRSRLGRKPEDGHPRARELTHLVEKGLNDGLLGFVVDPRDLAEHRDG